jgi:5-(carboxyamino)imidazole ribonucleotide synthase
MVAVVAKATNPLPQARVGVVGGGQLARMMGEAASALGIELHVLAAHADDPAAAVARVTVGEPHGEALFDFARSVDAVTLDHELVDLDALARAEAAGAVVAPSAAAVRFAARKDYQRTEMARHGVPVPRHVVLRTFDARAVEAFAVQVGGPPVVKAAGGGYDGRGVVVSDTVADAVAAARELGAAGPVVLEERVEIVSEVAVVFVTGRDGSRRRWPTVRTVPENNMCAEVLFPCGLESATEATAIAVAERVADGVGAVGVLAVELLVTPSGVLLNEVATRPHNSAHWTIEGAVTSQFENHLRAVLGWPLGATEARARAVAMVNIVGGSTPGSMADALSIRGAHVHDYGKIFRPGRKLGHVTALDDDVAAARVTAWAGAFALHTAATKGSP